MARYRGSKRAQRRQQLTDEFSDLGKTIPGSQYVRGYCWSCCEPMRVTMDELIRSDPLYCSRCKDEPHMT